jgi:hydrogenase maturation factor
MNVSGDLRYVSRMNLLAFDEKTNNIFKGKDNRIKRFKPGTGDISKMLACTRLSSVVIGDFVFVHAGFVDKFMEEADVRNINDLETHELVTTRNLLSINFKVRKYLMDQLNDENYVKAIINGNRSSLFWDRILGTLPPNLPMSHESCQKHLTRALVTFNVSSMVIGHTPQFHANESEINSTCLNIDALDGLYRVDFGGSNAFHVFDKEFLKYVSNPNVESEVMKTRKPQVLEITYDSIEEMKKLNSKPTVKILRAE